jgi:hypothetical protein
MPSLATMAALPAPGAAHLSMIRQGIEAAGFNEVGNQFGYSVAAGDFNGDGYDDLAIGTPQDDLLAGTPPAAEDRRGGRHRNHRQ